MKTIKYTFDIKYRDNQIINLGKGKGLQLIREDAFISLQGYHDVELSQCKPIFFSDYPLESE
jgi:hypothetical protein